MNRLVLSRHDYLRPPLWERQLAVGKFKFRLIVSRELAWKSARAARCPIANRVAVLRCEHGISRLELAQLLGIYPATLDALERGSYLPSLELAMRVSACFDLPIQAIFFSSIDEDTVLVESHY